MSIARYINYSETRPEFVQLFQNFRGGVGGPCSVYDPPFSYWCAEETQGGGKAQFTLPGGVVYSPAQLPHAPYKNATGAVYVPFGLCSGHVRVASALPYTFAIHTLGGAPCLSRMLIGALCPMSRPNE